MKPNIWLKSKQGAKFKTYFNQHGQLCFYDCVVAKTIYVKKHWTLLKVGDVLRYEWLRQAYRVVQTLEKA